MRWLELAAPLATVYFGVAAGYVLGRSRLPERAWAHLQAKLPGAAWAQRRSASQALTDLLFYLFIPALLFRAASRIDVGSLPLRTLAAYFVPAALVQVLLVAWARRQQALRPPSAAAASRSADADAQTTPADTHVRSAAEWPAVAAFAATFGNSVQLGIPVATALFGAAGLALHLQIIAAHALILMTLATVQAEWLRTHAKQAHVAGSLARVAATTARRALIHPVVLPIAAGLAWQAVFGSPPATLDALLQPVAALAVPLCVLAIGWTLADVDVAASMRAALGLVGLKLVALPALIGSVAAWGFGISGLPLWVLVMAAALPAGANALLFAQRYRVGQAEAAAAIVASTLAFAVTAPVWLSLLSWLAPLRA